MGYWGEGIFQNDTDLDNEIDIGQAACKITGDSEIRFYNPRNRQEVVNKLNGGLFQQLLQQFLSNKEKDYIVILGALAMQLGATVSDDDKKTIRANLKGAYMHQPAKAQVRKALNEYKSNGEGWDFESSGLDETVMMTAAAGKGGYDADSKNDLLYPRDGADGVSEDFFKGAKAAVPGSHVSIQEMNEREERMRKWDEEQEAKKKERNEKKVKEDKGKDKEQDSGKDEDGETKNWQKENFKPPTSSGKDSLGSKATLQAWFGS